MITFSVSGNKLSSVVQTWGYNTTMTLGNIQVLGVDIAVKSVTIDSKAVTFMYKAPLKV